MKKHIVFDCDGTLVDTSTLKYQLYPGIKELVTDLAQDSVLYVWTARDRKSTLRILSELGIHQYFESICTVDDALPKPHVSGLLSLVGHADKNSVCVIGDTSNDILGAKGFGVKSIGAVWNHSASPAILREVEADFIASAPDLCLEWLRQNVKSHS